MGASWIEITSASGFTVPIAGGTLSWSFNNPTAGAVLGCSGTIDIPSQITAPSTPTISLTSVTSDSITVSYGTTSFGVPSTGTVYLYGGTSSNPTTQITSKTTTGQSSFTWTGLNASTTYYLRSNAANGSATSVYSTELVATTSAPVTTAAFYGSVGGQTKKVKKLYGPVEVTEVTGVTGEIEQGATMITAFDADAFWSHHAEFNSLEVSSIWIINVGEYAIYLNFSDGTTQQRLFRDATVADCAEYGLTVNSLRNSETVYLTPIRTPTGEYETKLVKKLYGSHNGVTKLVYEA